MEKIKLMALRHSAFYSPYLMTFVEGFLQQQGLEPSYEVASDKHPVEQSLLNGYCQVSQSAIATRFADLEAGKQSRIRHFAQINQRDGFFLAAREPDPAFSWSKLKGKKVLVDHFFQPYAMFAYALNKQGMSFADFEVIDAGDVSQIEQAFRNGEADYVHLQGPYPQQLEADAAGYVVAAIGEVIGPVAFSSLCADQDWLDSEMASAFLTAYKQSMQYVTTAEPIEIARKQIEAGLFPTIELSVLSHTIASYQQSGCWDTDINTSEQAFNTLLDVFIHSGAISKRYDYGQIITAID
ncbi:MAG: ABC transporter substrate-binding protein [Gammaproteobacteria bacterium]|nr:ABC transporter substrate-binding protein [Gammaproteobacteria bacterium]